VVKTASVSMVDSSVPVSYNGWIVFLQLDCLMWVN
jgi:hypothetical protein